MHFQGNGTPNTGFAYNAATTNNWGSATRIGAAGAGLMLAQGNGWYWHSAVSSTAGSAITWVPTMSLSETGALILGGAMTSKRVTASDASNFQFVNVGTSGADAYWRNVTGGVQTLGFAGVGTDPLSLTSTGHLTISGNIGAGANPAAWNTSFRAVHSLNGSVAGTTGNDSYYGANWYYTVGGVSTYIAADYALVYAQELGQHIFRVAPSGSAGAAITFTDALVISNAGALTTTGPLTFNSNNIGNAATVWMGPDGGGGMGLNVPTGESILLCIANAQRITVKPNTTNLVLPTNTTGLASGDLWNDSGVVKIV